MFRILLFSFIFLSGCTTTVMTMPDGKNKYVTRAENKSWAESMAISTANKYCKDHKKNATIIKEPKALYIGETDETVCNTANRVAIVVPGGQPVVRAATGPCLYEAEILFECK